MGRGLSGLTPLLLRVVLSGLVLALDNSTLFYEVNMEFSANLCVVFIKPLVQDSSTYFHSGQLPPIDSSLNIARDVLAL